MEKIDVMIQISEMYGADQAVRRSQFYLHKKGFSVDQITNDPALKARQLEIDTKNSEALKAIVEKWGWPTISNFSDVTDKQAWIIVQHADHDPDMQEDMLKLIKAAVEKKDSFPANFAYLYDRVYHRKGKKQVYGTQGECKGKGDWQPYELRFPDKIDKYRKSAKLGPMEDYKRQMSGSCV